jgi:hypothetical protein
LVSLGFVPAGVGDLRLLPAQSPRCAGLRRLLGLRRSDGGLRQVRGLDKYEVSALLLAPHGKHNHEYNNHGDEDAEKGVVHVVLLPQVLATALAEFLPAR